jgi:putative transposase
MGKRQNFTGENFWARGYFVSTVGRDEAAIKKYIREQEDENKRLDQLDMFKDT